MLRAIVRDFEKFFADAKNRRPPHIAGTAILSNLFCLKIFMEGSCVSVLKVRKANT